MATPKYKKYVEEMFQTHQEKMMKFMLLNQDYGQDKRKHKSLFDNEGKEIQHIVEDWTSKLCNQMEKGQNNAYSAKLADKFLAEVQKYFPYYHEIGITIR
ncbi:hypothetical protein COW94_02210 [Candidatus Peregrinibacteria bacterium CG22_combo_CG10-13_8_21_14_all_44_10]|nr:MAG: hypothetical protein AUK45_00245 [Candidatus Peregrinibacteria bacterium CG2_30_44_17]PIP66364.1 MAG: hypothetical protein COW94_02210 [Candidatus Peregrinibacteria bacterium CG22_combo_CG10-13_8_21_14_all_44_10]PIS04140.1 MAG: hypothetical protein COT83_02205 [Candidatus Peregrinibacteria bacterium CG10_big_fil_rev_8_21_14_0_10_44_7]PIX79218.1 MAG: hypothetical protein COZ35_03870 [Candidatus Peregrinibacteria bacterium CG_4_10_14_3_um_filter_44_21]PJB89532.1 MAG: hypothetical protein 